MEKYTEREILDAIKDEYVNSFGQLRDDDIERDGYFVIGIVSAALRNIDKPE
jgi:hypothetical protein